MNTTSEPPKSSIAAQYVIEEQISFVLGHLGKIA